MVWLISDIVLRYVQNTSHSPNLLPQIQTLFIAYVREGSYNTLLPGTTSSEEEEEERDQSSEGSHNSLRRSGKRHGSKSPKKRGARKYDDEVSSNPA